MNIQRQYKSRLIDSGAGQPRRVTLTEILEPQDGVQCVESEYSSGGQFTGFINHREKTFGQRLDEILAMEVRQ